MLAHRRFLTVLLALLPLAMAPCVAPRARAESPYRLYIDADWSNSLPSSRAIEQGILTALDGAGGRLGGRDGGWWLSRGFLTLRQPVRHFEFGFSSRLNGRSGRLFDRNLFVLRQPIR